MSVLYEKLFRNILFPLYEGPIRRRHTHRYLLEYEDSQWLKKSEIAALQLSKLNALLDHCWTNVPFLKSYWSDAGLAPASLRHISELAMYPTISKQIITENYAQMRAGNYDGVVLTKTTGGSTGDPFRFEYTEENYARRTAVMWRGYRWCGSDLGRRTAYVWGIPSGLSYLGHLKDYLYHKAFNRLMLNAFTMNEGNYATYVAALNRFRPKVVVGYVAPLVILARWMLENDVSVIPPRAIISGAEALTQPDREIISEAFGAPVFNTYGCREFMLLASECEHRNGLHISADHLVVETVDDRGSLVMGESGDVCVTDLHNYAMPFVRYLNGDRATATRRDCPCGRQLPLLESVDGRELDVIVTPDGRTVPGEFFVYVMLDFPDIRQYQVVQVTESKLEIRIVLRPGEDFRGHSEIVEKIAANMGDETDIVVCEVTEIPSTASGKRRITVSEIQ